MAKIDLLAASGATLTSVIHPGARVSRFAGVGSGSVVFAGAVVIRDVSDGVTIMGVPERVGR